MGMVDNGNSRTDHGAVSDEDFAWRNADITFAMAELHYGEHVCM